MRNAVKSDVDRLGYNDRLNRESVLQTTGVREQLISAAIKSIASLFTARVGVSFIR